MRKPAPKPRKQVASPELRDQCMDLLQRKFYPTHPIPFQKDRDRLLAWVVLWPAKWFNQRGVTVEPDRYFEIFSQVFMDGLRYGDLETITYLPAWLAKVIQSHFEHHGEEYYNAAKTIRENKLVKDLLSGNLVAGQSQPDPIREMAAAARLLKPSRKKTTLAKRDQLDLL